MTLTPFTLFIYLFIYLISIFCTTLDRIFNLKFIKVFKAIKVKAQIM